MITDLTLDAWKRWLTYSISRAVNTSLNGIAIQMRDSANVKTYPGIYIEAESTNRFESGGVMDGNSFMIEFETKLVTTPGEDGQVATSKAAHDVLRNALAAHVGDVLAEGWIDSQIGIACHQLLTTAPETTEEEGYRVTTWKVSAVAVKK
jgi:hypothetical protein